MQSKIDIIVDEISLLTLTQISDLIHKLETKFDIDSSMLNITTSGPLTSTEPENKTTEIIEEQVSFDLILSEVPQDKKIPVLKIVRVITGLGLKESKDIVDNVPRIIKEGISKEEVENFKKELESLGAKVVIK